jgi:hypothetical protein
MLYKKRRIIVLAVAVVAISSYIIPFNNLQVSEAKSQKCPPGFQHASNQGKYGIKKNHPSCHDDSSTKSDKSASTRTDSDETNSGNTVRANTGHNNRGSDNTGHNNRGSDNTGSGNTGHNNRGSDNTGSGGNNDGGQSHGAKVHKTGSGVKVKVPKQARSGGSQD